MNKNEKNNSVSRKNLQKKKLVKPPVINWTKVVIRIVTILLVAAILFCGSWFGVKKITQVKTEYHHALVERQLAYCQEFVTLKNRYSDIVTLKKSAGFAKAYSIVKYSGIVRCGIADFTDISYSISTDGKRVELTVPAAEVLGNELTSQEVFDEKRSIFVPITTQEIFDEIAKSQQEALEDLIAEGILEEAHSYAVKIITQFMLSCGFEEVIIH